MTTTLAALIHRLGYRLGVWLWHARRHFRGDASLFAGWAVASVHAFCERTGDYKRVPTAAWGPLYWEDVVDEETGWDADTPLKVELRYTYTNSFGYATKYRMVLRRGDACVWPPVVASTTLGGGGLRGILAADLVPRDPQIAAPVDLTRRLVKYAGPNKDFHAGDGLTIRACDVLPFDDMDAVKERFGTLRLLKASLAEIAHDLDDNPCL